MWPFKRDDEGEKTTAPISEPAPPAPPAREVPLLAAPAPRVRERENTILAGTTIVGDIKSSGSLRVEGTISGTIDMDGTIIIEQDGAVDGSIRAKDVVVHGRVRGDIEATGLLEVGPTGRILGDLSVQNFRMHDGGVFHGTSRMPGAEDLAKDAPPKIAGRARGGTLPPKAGAVPPPSNDPGAAGAISVKRFVGTDERDVDDAIDAAIG